jgi:hypothetical protein
MENDGTCRHAFGNACGASTSVCSKLEGSLRLTSTRFVCVMVENHQIYWQRGPGVYGHLFQQVVPDSCFVVAQPMKSNLE